MKKIAAILLFFALMSNAHAECSYPTDGMSISSDIILCEGNYTLPNGIIINQDDIELNCNNAMIIGSSVNTGIMIEGRKGVNITACVIKNFDVGIYLKNSDGNTLLNNKVAGNNIGIGMYSSPDNYLADNEAYDNYKENIFNYSIDETSSEESIEDSDIEFEKKPTTQDLIEQIVRIKTPNLSQNDLKIEIDSLIKKHLQTKDNLVIERTFRYNRIDNITEVIIRIKPARNFKEIKLYDFIPKCVALYFSDIAPKDKGYEIIKDDPLVMWHFNGGDKKQSITYSVNKIISKECRTLFNEIGIGVLEDNANEEKELQPRKNNLPMIMGIALVVAIITMYTLARVKTKI